MSDDDAYEPTAAGILLAGMSEDAQWASLTEDVRNLVRHMRQAADADDVEGVDPEKVRAIATRVERQLPVTNRAAAKRLATVMRLSGLLPGSLRERRG